MKKQSQVQALRRRIDSERNAAGANRVRFSDGLRRDVVALAKHQEWSRDRLAEALGVASSLLYRWCTLQSGEKNPKKRSRGKLARVRVVAAATGDAPSELELEFRSGAKLRGLTLAQVAELLGATT